MARRRLGLNAKVTMPASIGLRSRGLKATVYRVLAQLQQAFFEPATSEV